MKNLKRTLFLIASALLLSLPTASAESTEIATTDITTFYIFLTVMVLFFLVSVFLSLVTEINALTIASMLIAMLTAFKISNLFVDGTLTKTESFINATDAIITHTEVIRNPAASSLFEYIGIIFAIVALMQVYQFLRETRTGDDE